MMWKRYWLLVTVSIAQAQNHQVRWKPTDENLSSTHATLSDLIDRNDHSKTFSPPYDPTGVCFNPHHYNYFANHMMNKSPVPRPNFYNIERIVDDEVECPRETACPRETERIPKKDKEFRPNFFHADHKPSIPSSWNNYFSSRNQIVPLIYFPSATKDGHIDFRAIEYLKRLRNALNENPLLSRNRTAGKFNEVKINALPIPRERPFTKADGKTAFSGRRMASDREIEKTSNNLKEKLGKTYADRTKNEHNFKVTNKYPLPKFIYVNGKIAPPSTYYDRRKLFTDFTTTFI